MKIRCTNVITSTDKKILTPFVKVSVYEAEQLIINSKTIPNEWVINGAERPHKNDSGWIAIAGWEVGMFIPGIATFDEVKDAPTI